MLRILPSRERVEEELLEVAWRDGVSLGGGALTLLELVALLAPREPVDAIAQRAILEGCSRGLDLGPLHTVRGRAGFAGAALEAIGSLKAGRCTSEELSSLAQRAQGPRSARLKAIAHLYSAYEHALSDRSVVDPSDRLAHAVVRLDDLHAPLPQVLASAPSVVFEDLYDFTPLRLELVLALARRFEANGRGQRVQLLLPHDPERPELTAFVDPTWEAVYRHAQETRALDLAPKVYGDAESGPAGLARQLFRSGASPPWQGPPCRAALVVRHRRRGMGCGGPGCAGAARGRRCPGVDRHRGAAARFGRAAIGPGAGARRRAHPDSTRSTLARVPHREARASPARRARGGSLTGGA